jgi:hypothetical protein
VDSRRLVAGLVLLLAAASLQAGCGGGKSAGKNAQATPAIPKPGQAKADVKRNWEKFFDGSTPAPERVRLLQHGPQFASLIKAINDSPLAKKLKATVSSVEVTEQGTAAVTYTLLLDGKPLLQDASGTAVLVAGMWKVGVGSFCKLLAVQQVFPQGCPAALK